MKFWPYENAKDISGKEIIKALRTFGYEILRQNGSHIMITTNKNGQHHLAIPDHNPLKIGTLNGVVSKVAKHFEISKEQVLQTLFG